MFSCIGVCVWSIGGRGYASVSVPTTKLGILKNEQLFLAVWHKSACKLHLHEKDRVEGVGIITHFSCWVVMAKSHMTH